MSTKNKQEYYDAYDNPEIIKELRKGAVTRSQCGSCKYRIGTTDCKLYGKRPIDYADPLAKVSCPHHKEG